jgi:4-amino-4-deoxy-L-arabinose transferase-like glycosyltransferase
MQMNFGARFGIVQKIIHGFIFILLLYFAFVLRAQQMYPLDEAVQFQFDYGEGVYITSAQMMLQGWQPYRDFLFVQPPGALVLVSAILQLHFIPWGDPASFILVRYASITAGWLSTIVVYGIARRIAGNTAALLTLGLIATDALIVINDRRAMLEPYANLFSALAILCYLIALDKNQNRTLQNGYRVMLSDAKHRVCHIARPFAWLRMTMPKNAICDRTRYCWLIGAGIFGAFAMLIKTLSAFALIAILGHALARIVIGLIRPSAANVAWRKPGTDLALICIGAISTLILVSGYFIAASPESFFSQVYLFQLLRPRDLDNRWDQWMQIVNAPDSHFTIVVFIAGLATVLVYGSLRGNLRAWALILAWMLGLFIALAFTRTFSTHYYNQAALPIAVIAGGLLQRANPVSPQHRWRKYLALIVQGGAIAFILLTQLDGAHRQVLQAQMIAGQQSRGLRDAARFLAANSPAQARVFTMEPIFAFVATRPLAGLDTRTAVIDSYGFLIYTNLGLAQDHPVSSSDQPLLEVMHQDEGQQKMIELARAADYLIIEHRARWQLTQASLISLTAERPQIYQRDGIRIYGARETPR